MMTISSQVFVRCFDGHSLCLQIDGSELTGLSLRRKIHEKTLIPPSVQRIVTGTREITEEFVLKSDDSGLFPSVNLLLRLRGGKGGFGSLLRGAATKAGQKKTNNFDACRDMSGRRLRHVNAERRLEEWKAEAEERKLEKIAEEFLKKQTKKEKSKPVGNKAEKYLDKYRAETSKSIDEVRAAVQESFVNLHGNVKRKGLDSDGQASKRLKGLWVLEEDEADEEDADEKSVVLDEANLVHNGAAEQDDNESPSSLATSSGLGTDSISGSSSPHTEGISSDCDSAHDGLPDSSEHADKTMNDSIEHGSSSTATDEGEHEGSSATCGHEDTNPVAPASFNPNPLDSEIQCAPENSETATGDCVMNEASGRESQSECDRVFDLHDFQTPKDLEVLGMERLKVELQTRGLKCGGTLQQRAERLFLLKIMPMDMIPKKHLAKTK